MIFNFQQFIEFSVTNLILPFHLLAKVLPMTKSIALLDFILA